MIQAQGDRPTCKVLKVEKHAIDLPCWSTRSEQCFDRLLEMVLTVIIQPYKKMRQTSSPRQPRFLAGARMPLFYLGNGIRMRVSGAAKYESDQPSAGLRSLGENHRPFYEPTDSTTQLSVLHYRNCVIVPSMS